MPSWPHTRPNKLPWDLSSQVTLITKSPPSSLKSVNHTTSTLLKAFFLTNSRNTWSTETRSFLTRKPSTKKLKNKSLPFMMSLILKLWSQLERVSQRTLMWDAQFTREPWIKFITWRWSKADNSSMKSWTNTHHSVSAWTLLRTSWAQSWVLRNASNTTCWCHTQWWLRNRDNTLQCSGQQWWSQRVRQLHWLELALTKLTSRARTQLRTSKSSLCFR